MKILYRPANGYFEYFCFHCGAYLGNSKDDKELLHPAFWESGLIWVKAHLYDCQDVAKLAAMPLHVLEAKELCEKE